MAIFRKAFYQDLDAIEQIINDAVELLKNGGIDQWQNGYPNREAFLNDIENDVSYVVEDEGEVTAVCAVIFGEDETYKEIYDGQWITEADCYPTVHRVAVSKKHYGKGYPSFLFSEVEKMARERGMQSIRIDTHMDNKAMQRTLDKNGFERCGIIKLLDPADAGALRIAYEKLI